MRLFPSSRTCRQITGEIAEKTAEIGNWTVCDSVANISKHTTCAFSHENRLTFGPGGCCPGPEDPLRWVLDDLLHFYIFFFTNLKEFCRVQRKSEDNRNVPFLKKRSEGVHRREWKIYHSSTLQWEIFEWIYRHIDVNVDELWIYLFNGPVHKRTLLKKNLKIDQNIIQLKHKFDTLLPT